MAKKERERCWCRCNNYAVLQIGGIFKYCRRHGAERLLSDTLAANKLGDIPIVRELD